MKKALLLFILAQTCLHFCYGSDLKKAKSPYQIDLKKIEDQKGQINYTLSEIVEIIESSIGETNQVVLPDNTTEFEKSLFIARRVQHNDSQLVAIRMLKLLLEFESYRTRGEELYIMLLISNSLDYIGAPLIAYNYVADVFPAILKEIDNSEYNAFILNHHAGLLVKLRYLEEAKLIYKNNLEIYQQINNQEKLFDTRNNLGYVYLLSKEIDSAKTLFKENQNPIYKTLNPVLYAFSFGNYGTALKAEGKYDSCIFYLREEIRLLTKIGTNEGLTNAFFVSGECYEEKENLDSASLFYHKALTVSKEEKNLFMITKSYKSLIRLYTIDHNIPELNFFIKQYLSYNDSLINLKNSKAIQDEIRVSQFLDIFRDAKNSKAIQDELKQNNRELLFISIFLTVLVLMLIITISVRQQNRKKLKGKNAELKGINKELKSSYSTISESNRKNEILLKELHHRVKNNLQIISSLFNLQLNASPLDSNTEKVFKDAKNRIHSISLVHKKIYQSDNVDALDFEEYLKAFSDELLKATPNEVDLLVDIKREPVPIESAIPLGLIFNELFTNSLKHAKQEDLLKISIQYKKEGIQEKFIYTDNGVGVKNTPIMKENESSIGVTLIHLLSEQLGCKIHYKEADDKNHGFWLSIEGNFNK